MKKIIIKTITIVVAFLMGIFVTGYLFNKGNLDMTSHMADATLPVLMFGQDEKYVNCYYGYTAQVDASCMRNAIMPLDQERVLDFAFEKYDAKLRKVSYEVRTIDMQRLIQDGEIDSMQDSGKYITGSIKVKDLLEDGEEYLLIFHVDLENYEDVRYFVRIKNSSYELVNACTQFAEAFHNATLNPNNDYPITQYLETDNTKKENSLGYVDIHSKYKKVIWDGMPVQESEAPTFTFLELEKDTVALKMNYGVTYQNNQGENEKYEVEDYYRIRKTNMRMYLLDYMRTAERIFDCENHVFEEQSFNLGIQWEDIPYMVNEEGSVVNFVVSDELWSYDIAQNKISKVFSFKNGNDRRGLHDEFEIQLVNMEDSGSMDFIVKGYMNRGRHEGETGASIMRYNSLTNTTEELLFVESGECADVFAQTVGKLIYISFDDKMYISIFDDIYAIDLNTKTVEELTTDLAEGDYLISRAGDMIAWQHGDDRFSSTCITTMDMKSGVQKTYRAESGEYLRCLGFSGNDFIYGICSEDNIFEDFAGNTLFPMHRVEIVDSKGDVIRDFQYQSKNKYVVSATMQSNRINLQCVSLKEDGTYTEALAEAITSSEEEVVRKIVLSEEVDEIKKTEQVFQHEIKSEGKRKMISPKQVVFEENRNLALEKEETLYYHAYGRGNVLGVYSQIRKAVECAYERMGVVTNAQGQVVWERGNRESGISLELSAGCEPVSAENSLIASLRLLLEQEGVYTDVKSALEKGKSSFQILKQSFPQSAEDFTGCNLSSVLYYVGKGNYVLAMTDANSAELIVGYDSQNVYVLEPQKGKMTKVAQKDAAAKYEACGNVFFSFL